MAIITISIIAMPPLVAFSKEEEKAPDPPPKSLSLMDYLIRFLASDARWRVAVLEKEIAGLATFISQDRFSMEIFARVDRVTS